MNCERIVDLLVDYFDGELEEQTAHRLEGHLQDCPGCVKFIETYRQTGSICREALRVEMPAPVKSTLFQFLRTQLQSPTS